MSEDQIGQRIKDLRKSKKLTLKTLSESTGINQGTLSLLENGENKPSFDIVMKLCKYFKTTADYLLFGQADNSIIEEVKNDINIPDEALITESIGQNNSIPVISSLIDIISADRRIIKETLDKALSTKDEVIKAFSQVIDTKNEVIKVHEDTRIDLKE
jgi:transcriptional regulator with XRE-family HTH domain